MPHSVLELIDSAVAGRVLLFGSLPPGGRDLDVLARPPEWRAIAAVLEREGFVGRGGTWVRFRRCTAEAVDLVATREWALGPSELAALWAEATPVGGARNVARPSPRHLLLILARQLVEGDGRLSATRRSRISAALAEDPEAWYRARAAAGPWGASRALGLLRLAHEGRRRVPP
ncbi:MAG: nucleotidyltransferase family protein, partial [Actinomycetota bacterium]|nr:nucleotidyltransferase family protein [Actinomycetota bacterium]